MAKKSSPSQKIDQQLTELQQQLAEVQEREKRVLADYQNLIRRNQEDRVKFAQLANRDLVESLLQPVEHLELAVKELGDEGLGMVLTQIKQVLADFGLQEIEVMGQKFDVETMEAVESSGEGQTVAQVVRKGYSLNGVIIQHAQVILE